MPCVGQPSIGLGLEHHLRRVGDLYTTLLQLQGQFRSHLPIRLERQPPMAPSGGRVGERLPESLGRRIDVGRVDELGLSHRDVLQCSLHVREGAHSLAVVVADPALGDGIDRRDVEVVQLLSTPLDRGHQIGRLQHRQVFADRLPGDVQPDTQFPQTLPIPGVQTVEQSAASAVAQPLEHQLHRSRPDNSQPFGGFYARQPRDCTSTPLCAAAVPPSDAPTSGVPTTAAAPRGADYDRPPRGVGGPSVVLVARSTAARGGPGDRRQAPPPGLRAGETTSGSVRRVTVDRFARRVGWPRGPRAVPTGFEPARWSQAAMGRIATLPSGPTDHPGFVAISQRNPAGSAQQP